MKTWTKRLLAGCLLLAGCASVEPAVVEMHGGDSSIASRMEAPYEPPPDLTLAGGTELTALPAAEVGHEHGSSSADVRVATSFEPAAERAFSCPMHPNVLSRKPGTCPECGMTLEPVDAAEVYSCPMHPEVMSRREGTCPKCGMNLQKPGESR